MLNGKCEDTFLEVGIMDFNSDHSLISNHWAFHALCNELNPVNRVFSAILKSSDPTHEVKTSP